MVLYCTVLCCIVLLGVAGHCQVDVCRCRLWDGIVLYCNCRVLVCLVLYRVVFFCAVSHCIVLSCIVLYCIASYCMALYCIVLSWVVLFSKCCVISCCIVVSCDGIVSYCDVLRTALSYSIRYDPRLFYSIQGNGIHHDTIRIQYDTVQCDTVQCKIDTHRVR